MRDPDVAREFVLVVSWKRESNRETRKDFLTLTLMCVNDDEMNLFPPEGLRSVFP